MTYNFLDLTRHETGRIVMRKFLPYKPNSIELNCHKCMHSSKINKEHRN